MARAKTSQTGSSQGRKKKAAAAAAGAGASHSGNGNGNGRSWPADVQEEIRVRAYELYEQRCGAGGSEQDDWVAAEREVLSRLAGQGK